MSNNSVYFCRACVEHGVELSSCEHFPNNMVLGCASCPIRDTKRLEYYRELFHIWRFQRRRLREVILEHPDGEWLLLCGANTYFPSCVEGQKQSYSIREQCPKEQWVSKSMDMLLANLKLLKSGMGKCSMPVTVCLATLSRKGLITATISKVIVLMLGNGLINKFEEFDRIVYTEGVLRL